MNTTNSERNVKEVDQETDRIAKEIVDSAFQVHTHLVASRSRAVKDKGLHFRPVAHGNVVLAKDRLQFGVAHVACLQEEN